VSRKIIVLPRISVVIPCYNHGKYIDEALQSVEQIADKTLYEIIIINDGSTDPFTNEHLAALSAKGYHVINQENKGLAATRNVGITAATGEYILPLDADNKITPDYIYKSISIMDRQADVAVVYSDARLFGETNEDIQVSGTFNLQRLMLGNFIDACAVFRKEVWVKNKGYDEQMTAIIPGLEDWEFWLHAAFNGFKFHYVPEPLFYYRVLSTSMLRHLQKKKAKNVEIIEYLIEKHPGFFGPQYIDEDLMKKFHTSPTGFIGKIFLKRFFPERFQKMVAQGKLRKYI